MHKIITTPLKFCVVFAVGGTVLALALNTFMSLYEKHMSHDTYLLAFKFTLMFFPAAIATMSMDGSSYWGFGFFVLLGINALFYALLGYMTWLGIFKHKIFIAVEILTVAELWRRIFFLR